MAEKILLELKELIRENTNAKVWAEKDAGRPVIGYFCHYLPRELILAAGALPLRLRGAGSEDSSLGDSYMSGRVCTYVRHVMSLALNGRYDFLDGEVSCNNCDHVRRAADLFRAKSKIGFHGFVSVPRNPRESLYPYYREELQQLLAGLGEHFKTEIDAAELRAAIKVMNEIRSRLSALDRLRLLDLPKLSGAEALTVHIAAQVLPPRDFIALVDRLLPALEKRPGIPSRVRLVLIGAELDEPEYVEAIESQGAVVVADLLCFGSRGVLPPIDEKAADPLEAIGRAYFFRPSCARMIGDFPQRWRDLQTAVAAARADGVVFQRLVFCDPWGAELHNIMSRLKKENAFPMLALSREYGIVPSGQVKTRVQAFVEQIERAREKQSAGGGSS